MNTELPTAFTDGHIDAVAPDVFVAQVLAVALYSYIVLTYPAQLLANHPNMYQILLTAVAPGEYLSPGILARIVQVLATGS